MLTLGFSLNQCLNLLKGRFKRASKVLDRKFENVRGKFQGCLKSVSESLKKKLRVFKDVSHDVLEKLHIAGFSQPQHFFASACTFM